ncbi:HlyD family efflux transporter periplasmic adaptor subunit [Brevirhabdus sp.]|uniref:HlyD family efflux transporter periplasmic adaptor subunit n=1 Tax=Brevirhabdus sp. TaxID=2004514 RepID=UPI004059DD96
MTRALATGPAQAFSFGGAIWGGGITLGLLALLVAAWLAFATTSRGFAVAVVVRPEVPVFVLRAPAPGRIAEVSVRNGARVAKGDRLLRLDDRLIASEIARKEIELADVLARQRLFQVDLEGGDAAALPVAVSLTPRGGGGAGDAQRLEDMIENRRARARIERLDGLRDAQDVRLKTDALRRNEAALRRQQDLLAANLKDQETLHQRGLGRSQLLLAARIELEKTRERLALVRLSRARLHQETRLRKSQLAQGLMAKWDAAHVGLLDAATAEASLRVELRTLRLRRDRLTVAAPFDGVVQGLAATTGAHVTPGGPPLLSLRPAQGALRLHFLLQPDEVHKVAMDQRVSITLPTGPGRAADAIGPPAAGADVVEARIAAITPRRIGSQGRQEDVFTVELALPDALLPELVRADVIRDGQQLEGIVHEPG